MKRSENGKGVLIPGINNRDDFRLLRNQILAGTIEHPGELEPHITLMHPRNSTCTDHIFEEIEKQNLPTEICFKTLSLIEQVNGGKWKLVNQFNLQ